MQRRRSSAGTSTDSPGSQRGYLKRRLSPSARREELFQSSLTPCISCTPPGPGTSCSRHRSRPTRARISMPDRPTRSLDFLTLASSHMCSPFLNSCCQLLSCVLLVLYESGVWPESKSFDDSGIGAIPSQWNGTCMKGPDFSTSNCNK